MFIRKTKCISPFHSMFVEIVCILSESIKWNMDVFGAGKQWRTALASNSGGERNNEHALRWPENWWFPPFGREFPFAGHTVGRSVGRSLGQSLLLTGRQSQTVWFCFLHTHTESSNTHWILHTIHTHWHLVVCINEIEQQQQYEREIEEKNKLSFPVDIKFIDSHQIRNCFSFDLFGVPSASERQYTDTHEKSPCSCELSGRWNWGRTQHSTAEQKGKHRPRFRYGASFVYFDIFRQHYGLIVVLDSDLSASNLSICICMCYLLDIRAISCATLHHFDINILKYFCLLPLRSRVMFIYINAGFD